MEASIRVPKALRTEAFFKAWQQWTRYKKERKGKWTQSTKEFQLNKLAKYSPEVAVLMIEQSIEMGWTGLFPVRDVQKKAEINPTEKFQKKIDRVVDKLHIQFEKFCPLISARDKEGVDRFLREIRDAYTRFPGDASAGSPREGQVKYFLPSVYVLMDSYLQYVTDMFDEKPSSIKAIAVGSKLWSWFLDKQQIDFSINFKTGERIG